jgi:hypothetical protein
VGIQTALRKHLLAVALVLCSPAWSAGQESQSLMPTQLTGLKAVGLAVTVDDGRDQAAALEGNLAVTAKRILMSYGIRLDDDAPSRLRVTVQQDADPDRPTHVLVNFRVELAEKVRLERLPSLRVAQGLWGTTWSTTHAGIVARIDVQSTLQRWVDTGVGSFGGWVATVNGKAKQKGSKR